MILTLGARFVLARLKLDRETGPPVLIYSSLAVLFTCTIWLVLFNY